MKYDESRMVLRYFLPVENHASRFKQLVNFLERTGIRRVILFTGSFVEESAFFPLDYYQEHAKILSQYIPTLKQMGVEIGINMLNTMGHVYYANDGEFDFTRALNQDGEPSTGWSCLMDDHLHEYIKKQYSFYAELKPDTIFLDDDVRYVKLNGLSCFCDKHLTAISKKLNKDITREQVKQELFSDFTLKNKTKEAVIVEMSYGFSHIAILSAKGYFDRNCIWHDEPLNVTYEIIANIFKDK